MSVGEDVDKLEPLYIAGESIKPCSHSGKIWYIHIIKYSGQVWWWLTPVIPELWETRGGLDHEVGVQDSLAKHGQHNETPSLLKIQKISHSW